MYYSAECDSTNNKFFKATECYFKVYHESNASVNSFFAPVQFSSVHSSVQQKSWCNSNGEREAFDTNPCLALRIGR